MESHSGLERFLEAQSNSFDEALSELLAGRKRTHWMWYILPQLRGLGRSEMAYLYGIADRQEAQDYLKHPVLGPRLVRCVQAMLTHRHANPAQILGEVDALKLHSCLTLFAAVAPAEPCFTEALATFYRGRHDQATLDLLGAAPGSA